LEEERNSGQSLSDRLKNFMTATLDRFGFLGILLFASIPNPLFDLAGLTCGHCLVPFLTFFGATLIGKAIIKVHIQTLFVLAVFRKDQLSDLIAKIETIIWPLKGKLYTILENEKAKFHNPHTAVQTASKGGLAMLWDVFLMLMIAYFVSSIINSTVQEYLIDTHEQQVQKLIKSAKTH